MSRKMPLLDKIRNHGLGETRRLAVHQITRRNKCLQKRRRYHRVTKPQAGEKRLVQGPDIDHALAVVETLQRRKRPAAITKFAGIVVFDNPRLGFTGPTEKLETPRHR